MQSTSPSSLLRQMKRNIAAGYPTMVWGSPGIGKSDIPKQLAKEMDIGILDFRANLFDPVDVRGIPYLCQKENGDRYTSWAVPDVFPIVERDGNRGILFIDEFPTAPPATQNAFLQLLLDKQIGNYELPPGWAIVAAGNRLTDSAAVYKMPAPVKNRFAHFELEPTLDDWKVWAIQNGINENVIAFISYRNNLLSSFDPDSYAFPTPRAWAMVSKMLNTQPHKDDLFGAVASLVGEGAAGEFVAFNEIRADLPDLDYLIANPHTYKRDNNPALLYALATGLSVRATDATLANIMQVTNQIVKEYQVVVMKGIYAKDPDFRQHPDVRDWVVKNKDKVL